jgi:hypothetical protein
VLLTGGLLRHDFETSFARFGGGDKAALGAFAAKTLAFQRGNRHESHADRRFDAAAARIRAASHAKSHAARHFHQHLRPARLAE